MAWLPSQSTRTIEVVTAVVQVTISSDKDVYVEGDRAKFSGYVRDADGRGMADKRVVVTIDSPYKGYEIGSDRTDSTGYWEVYWTIPWYVYWGEDYREIPGTDYKIKAESEGVSGTVTITIAWRTRISISAPASVKEGEEFTVSGILEYEKFNKELLDGEWIPLGYQDVSVYYDNTLMGTARTDPMTGAYSVSGSIPTTGTYTLKAVYEGTALLLGAEKLKAVVVGVPLYEVLKTVAPLGAGLLMIAVSRRVGG